MAYKKKKKPSSVPANAIVTHMSHDARGVSTHQGKTTFIFGALPDEQVEFQYEQTHSRFDEAYTLRVLENPNPNRQAPKCAHFNVCGGCQLQHLTYEAQTQYKQNLLHELLHQQRIAPQTWLSPLVSKPWGYRRKARLSAKYVLKKQQMMLGFRERKSHLVTALHECPILIPTLANKITALCELLSTLEAKQTIPQLEIAAAQQATALILRHLQPLSNDDIEKLKQFENDHHIQFYLQSQGLDSIIPLNAHLKNQSLYYDLSEDSIRIFFKPEQFIQINDDINQKMLAQAIDLLELQPDEQLLDLFCGVGNFSLPLGLRVKTVVGIEAEPSLVAQAKENAIYNQLNHCHFYADNLFLPSWQAQWSKMVYDKIILDPPRAGADFVCKNIRQWQSKKILYVSCNPMTLVRDANTLKQQGYELEKIGIIDMFPQTKHVEVMALFHAM